MNQDKYVFAQLTDFLPYEEFKYLIKKFQGNSYYGVSRRYVGLGSAKNDSCGRGGFHPFF
jgi:hypothetical protein